MDSKPGLPKKLYITLILGIILSLMVLNSIFNIVHCNMTRDYKGINEKFYQDVKEKIQKLEKEEFKDAAAISRLAQQYNLLAIYYLDRRLWDMAIDTFNASMKYGNANDNTFYSLGLAHANRGVERNSQDDINKAEYYYRKAIELNGSFLDAKYALSILLFYHRSDGKVEAERLVNEIILKNRAHYPARFAGGRFNYEMGNKQKALTIYQELEADLDKLPPSGINNEYKLECKNNIAQLMAELSMR